MNRIEISGNLGKEPEVRQLQNGIAVSFSINDSEGYMDRQTNKWIDKSSWFNVSWFPDQNDNSYLQLHKGMRINVVGKMKQRSYQSQDGQKHFAWELIPDKDGISIILRTSKQPQQASPIQAQQAAPAPVYAPPYQQAPPNPQYQAFNAPQYQQAPAPQYQQAPAAPYPQQVPTAAPDEGSDLPF